MFSVLAVDADSTFLSSLLSHASAWPGITIHPAETEVEAEDLLGKEIYDAIISEYALPEKDGISFLRHVRARYGEIPFILVTGRGSEDVAVEASRYGISAYFRKGGDETALLHEIYGKIREEAGRKEKTEALKARETRCRSILESHSGYICRINPDLMITFCNRAFSETTGISPENLAGSSFSACIVEDDRDILRNAVSGLNKENPSSLCTLRIRPKEKSVGNGIWTEWTFTAAFDPGSSCTMIQGIGRDISREREVAEKEKQHLRDMEFLSRTAMAFLDIVDEQELYQFIVSKVKELEPSSVVTVCETDMKNQTIMMKAVACDEDVQNLFIREFGVNPIGFSVSFATDPSASVLLQKKGIQEAPSLYYLFMGKLPLDACRRFEEILAIGKIYLLGFSSQGEIFGQVIILLKEGYDLVNTGLIEAFTNQASVALLRLRTRNALWKSEERYKAVVENQNDLIYRFSPDGTPIFANDAFNRYFSVSLEITGDRRFVPDIPGVDREMLARHLSSLSPAFPAGMVELRTRMPDGKVRWQQWNTRAIFTEQGDLIEYQSVGRDITERKHAEEELERFYSELEEKVAERTRDLQAANRDLSTFTYSVSHDLKGPLRAIDGYSALFLKMYGQAVPPESRQMIEKIRENSVKMIQLIDSLLALSRASRKVLSRETVDMEQLAREVLEDMLGHERGRQIETRIGPLPVCTADPVLIRQVFQNLISNALKFTRSRDIAQVDIGSSRNDGAVVYYIRDNGVGFDTAYADRLFRVFERLHSDPRYEGTGVGLSIVEQILERHGGGIRAESSPDKGCTFFFTLTGGSPPSPPSTG